MATFRKRGPYQWEAQIRRRGYPAQSKTFETKVEAEAWAKMIESEMSRGVWVSRVEAEATSLHDALVRYEAEVVPRKKGSAQEVSILRMCKSLDLAPRPLAAIRSADLARLRDHWLKECSPGTVLRRLAVLSHVFTVCRKEWGMESLANPVELIAKPLPNNARKRRLVAEEARDEDAPTEAEDESNRNAGDAELEAVVAASRSPLLPSIVWLAVETAMRRSEIVDLLWENIDLKRRVAHLPATKNGDSRDVPLSPRAVSILAERKAAADEAKKSDESAEGDAIVDSDADDVNDGRVFGIRRDAVTRAFERAVNRARKSYLEECKRTRRKSDARYLTDLRFHDLRHEASTRLAATFPLLELTRITGHKDPRMLMRYYHPRAEDLAKRMK